MPDTLYIERLKSSSNRVDHYRNRCHVMLDMNRGTERGCEGVMLYPDEVLASTYCQHIFVLYAKSRVHRQAG